MNFIKNIKFKDVYCGCNGSPGDNILHKYINLYIKIADNCNANCKFCEYHNIDPSFTFNIEKFIKIINYFIKNNIVINKVSFTGGEPTTNFNILAQCIEFLSNLKIRPFIVVNTNGYKLNQLNALQGIDSISLSRHAISDVDHCKIMQCRSVPDASQIKNIASNKIHLTCNLIKGNIDSSTRVVEYLEFCNALNIYDVGFVSLMPINNYCETHHIDFDDINIHQMEVTVCNRTWEYSNICKCKNFLYLPSIGNRIVKFYMRYRCQCNSQMPSTLVYDGEHLRVNFNSEILI